MAEVTCPSPFSAAGSLKANIQVECVPQAGERSVFWNSSDKGPTIVLSNNDLTVSASSTGDDSVRATVSQNSGKWYWEERVDAKNNDRVVGIGTSAASLSSLCGWDTHGYSYHRSGYKYHNGSFTSWGASWSTVGDVIGVALNLDTGKIWFSKNGVWQESGDPAAGTNEAFSGISGTFFPMTSVHGVGDTLTARFNATDFTYTPPAGFSAIDSGTLDAFVTVGSLASESECLWVDIESPLTAAGSLSAIPQSQISGSTLTAVGSSSGVPIPAISAKAFSVVAGFTCDHCFNYAQVAGTCPTPTSEIDAVFRWARIDASPPVPTASFVIGKKITGDSPVPDFTCIAYHGRNPSLVAITPCPTCSMRVGLVLSDVATISRKAGVPVPTGLFVATSAHLATIYGNVPCPLLTCNADTENITVISASVPCPTGLFETTIGNVASIVGRAPYSLCTMVALTGQVVTLSGRVPVPGNLVRFYASLANRTLILEGTIPTPTMTSRVPCLGSLILRHIRNEVR